MIIIIRLIVFIMLTCFAVEDILCREISTKKLIFFLLVGLGCRICDNTLLSKDMFWGILIGIAFIIIGFVFSRHIGLGDGIIFLLTGIYLGGIINLKILLISVTLAGMAGGFLLVVRKKGGTYKMPFALFILLGYLGAII